MGEAKLAIFPLPMGKQRFVCDRISQGELAMGNFRRYVKRTKELPMTVPEVSSTG